MAPPKPTPHSTPSNLACLESGPDNQSGTDGTQKIAAATTNANDRPLKPRKPQEQPAKRQSGRPPIHPKPGPPSRKRWLGRPRKPEPEGVFWNAESGRPHRHPKADSSLPESASQPPQSAEPVAWRTLQEALDHMARNEVKAGDEAPSDEDMDDHETETLEYAGNNNCEPLTNFGSEDAMTDRTIDESDLTATESTISDDSELTDINTDDAESADFDYDAEELTSLPNQEMDDDPRVALSTVRSNILNSHVASIAPANPTEDSAADAIDSAEVEIGDFYDMESEDEGKKATSNAEREAMARAKAVRERRAQLVRLRKEALTEADVLAPPGF